MCCQCVANVLLMCEQMEELEHTHTHTHTHTQMEELKGQRQALQEDADRKLRQVMREMDAQQRCALQVCACVRVCMHAYTHAHTHTHTHTHMRARALSHVPEQKSSLERAHAKARARAHTHTHSLSHTHTNTHVQEQKLSLERVHAKSLFFFEVVAGARSREISGKRDLVSVSKET